jgi:hypothetical protein
MGRYSSIDQNHLPLVRQLMAALALEAQPAKNNPTHAALIADRIWHRYRDAPISPATTGLLIKDLVNDGHKSLPPIGRAPRA